MFDAPKLNKPNRSFVMGMNPSEDPGLNYAVFHNGTKYKLPILEQFGDMWSALGFIGGRRVHVFKAKCWWAEGGSWWIGAWNPSERAEFGDLLGPFNDHEQAMVYLKLTQDEKK